MQDPIKKIRKRLKTIMQGGKKRIIRRKQEKIILCKRNLFVILSGPIDHLDTTFWGFLTSRLGLSLQPASSVLISWMKGKLGCVFFFLCSPAKIVINNVECFLNGNTLDLQALHGTKPP